jgi:hypothetical protein
MKAIINRTVYDTEKATEIANDHYWDGHNFERGGRNTHLFKTAKGNYFAHHVTLWQGEHDSIEPLTLDEAADMYEQLHVHVVAFEQAFPDIPLEEA